MNLYKIRPDYSADITSNAFLLNETRVVARLLASGLTMEAARERVIEGNLFNYATRKGIPKKFAVIRRRLGHLGVNPAGKLLTIIANGSHIAAAATALYAVYKTDRLFREFMDEVVGEKRTRQMERVGPGDMSLFLISRASQDSRVATWKDSTRKKLWEVARRILIETGIIDLDGMLMIRPMDPEVKSVLLDLGEYRLIGHVEGDHG